MKRLAPNLLMVKVKVMRKSTRLSTQSEGECKNSLIGTCSVGNA